LVDFLLHLLIKVPSNDTAVISDASQVATAVGISTFWDDITNMCFELCIFLAKEQPELTLHKISSNTSSWYDKLVLHSQERIRASAVVFITSVATLSPDFKNALLDYMLDTLMELSESEQNFIEYFKVLTVFIITSIKSTDQRASRIRNAIVSRIPAKILVCSRNEDNQWVHALLQRLFVLLSSYLNLYPEDADAIGMLCYVLTNSMFLLIHHSRSLIFLAFRHVKWVCVTFSQRLSL
jgi:hypothetical protein